MALELAGVKLIAQDQSAYIADMKSAAKATDAFVDGTEKGGGRVSAAGQVMIGALRQIGTIAIDAFAQAAKATAAFIGDSIGLAGDFESGMLTFQAVAGKDVDASGLEDFRDLFIDIGKRLPVSTMEVQQAAAEMVKGGIDPAIIAAGALEQNIQFAAAAMEGDLVKAAEISSKIMGGWAGVNATAAEKADFLTHATDLLTKAANASATDVEGLSRGIFQAQGIARTAGVSFDDLTTTLAELAPRFASSAEAGTSVKNMIARLQPTTDPATDAMKALGLYTAETGSAFYDAQGNFVGFQQASQLLQDSLKGLTKEQQASLLQTIFGNDAMGAAAGLAELGADGYQHMAESLANANGVADAAALKQQGFNTSLDNTKGSVEALQITIGSYLLPVLGDLLDNYVAPAINTLTDLASAVFGDDDAFNKLSPTMQTVAIVIGTLSDDIANIIGAFTEAGAGSSEFGESIGLLASHLGLPGELIQDIVFAAQDLVKWFGTANTETNALGGTVDDLNGIWTHALSVIRNVGDGYMAIAQSVLPIVTRFWSEHGAEISAFVKTTYDSIIQIVHLALEVYDTIVPPVLHAIADFISDHGSEITKILRGAWQLITSIITGALETIKGVFKLALDVLHGDWVAAWEDIKGIGKAQWDAISGGLEGFLNIIAGLFDTSLDEIAATWAHNWQAMVDLIADIGWWEAGKRVVEGIQDGINDAWQSLLHWFNDKVSGLVDAAMDAIGAHSPAEDFKPVGQFAVQGIMAGFASEWPSLTQQIGSLSGDLIDDMRSIGEQMQNAVADGFGATASIDRQIAKNLDSFKDVLPQYRQFTAGALKQVQAEAEAFLDPAEGAKFFAMRSKQILEYADLQKKLSEATSQDDRQRIEAQMILINNAQTAEISQFNANQTAQQSMAMQLADSINAVMMAIADIHLTDDQIKIVDMLSGVWAGLQAPVQTRADAYAHPPQMQYPSGSTGSTTTSTQNISMPIYTNQTPAAIQQSWAIVQASMP